MQLTSKMRFISTQFQALLSNNLWLKNAKHANDMTQILYDEIKGNSHITITQKVQVNSIFAILLKKHIKNLQKKYFFHICFGCGHYFHLIPDCSVFLCHG